MKPGRTLEILQKLVIVHKANPRLAMTDITNEEIIEALDTSISAVRLIIGMAKEIIRGEK